MPMEMRSTVLLLVVVIYIPLPLLGQRLAPPNKYHSDDEDHQPEIDEEEDELEGNSTDNGMYVGAPCENACNTKLLHVYCNSETNLCECEKKFPVKLNPSTGCSKPKRLGETCYYKETCMYSDPHASCIQIHHNAICQCISGYHSVSFSKPTRKSFCAEDLVVMTTDFSTFAGVVSGIAVLSGLICFVLKLFNQNLYTGRHRYGNAHLAPPILFNSDTDTSQPIYGSFLAVRDVAGSVPIIDRHLVSRAPSQRTLASSRRASSAPGYRGTAMSASRAGSRRPSIASVHSSNSIRSYSQRRYEAERNQKEEREMQRRLTRLSSSTNSVARVPPTPSPHSTDDLLPTLEEDDKKVPLALSEESASISFQEEVPSTSKQYPQN